MVAASILMARTLTPYDAMIENWRSWRSATGAWRRIEDVLTSDHAERETIALPEPVRARLAPYQREGLLTHSEIHLAATPKGMLVLNRLTGEVIDALSGY